MATLDLVYWIVLVAWLVWLLIYWRGGVGLVGGLKRSFHSSFFRYDGFLILGIVVFTTLQLWTGVRILLGRVVYPDGWSVLLLALVGSLFVVVGALGTMMCRFQLGKFWDVKAELFENHRVIDSGVYRIVRHPIYAFACLMSSGTILVFLTWWNLLAGILVIACYAVKALSEEKLLAENLPGYREYQSKVPYRLAPWIW